MVKDLNDPTNRDSVPAMLTPGEYVVNKEATQMYGPLIHAMNNHGLQQRHAENQVVKANIGKKISKLHGEGYTAPGQAYAIAKSMGYNQGGLVDFIKQEEGFRTKAYQDPGGVWTIGYGRTTNPDGSRIKPGQTTTRDAEDSWIQNRVAQERTAIKEFAKKHGYDWNEAQVDALASFRYNGGQGMIDQLTKDGTRGNDVISKKILQYHKQTMPDGTKKSLPGLVKRRKLESDMFSTGESAWTVQDQGAQAPAPQAPAPQASAPQADVQYTAEVPAPQGTPPIVAESAPQNASPSEPTSSDTSGGDWMPTLSDFATYFGFGQQAPVMHQTQRQFTQPEQIKSPKAVSSKPQVMMEDPMQPMYRGYNMGGWLSNLFGNDEDQKKLGTALAGRPGFRNADPLRNTLVPPNVPTAAPTGFSDVPPVTQIPNIPVPGSDEAILQGSSSQLDPSGAYAEWDQVTKPEQFVQEAQPKGVTGGSADPTGQSLETVGAPDLYQELTAPQQESYGSLPERAAATNAPSFTQPAASQAASVENAPVVDTSSPPEQKKETVKTKVGEVVAAEPPHKPEGGSQAISEAGTVALQTKPAEAKGAMDKIKGFFGDLFDADELKRAAVIYLGAMATGASPGQALAMSGQMYLGRVDAKAANESKLMNDLVKGGKYTPQSIKAYQQSGDPSDLTPVKAAAAGVGTGTFQEFYSPNGKKVNAEKIKIGDGQYVWMGENGEQINSKWKSSPDEVQGTREYTERVSKDSQAYTDMLKGLRGTFGTTKTRDGNEYATNVVPEVGGREIARWAIENNVDPALMGELVQNAYQAAIADSSGKKVNSLTPYLNDLYVKATVGDADLFKTPGGKAMGADKINGLIGGLTKQAMAAGKFGNSSEAVAKKAIISHFQKKWNELDQETRDTYNKQANKNESGFFVFMRKQTVG